MGKLLFVNTNRANGIIGLIVCAGAIMMGLYAVVRGAYGGIVIVPLGIYGGKFCLKMASQRTELFEQGFVSKNIFGEARARYSDLKSISRGAISRNGVLQTNINFMTQSGQIVTITNEKFLKGDDKMEMLLDHASGALAETWAKTLERQTEVVWLMKGSSPLLKIRKEGVLVEGKPGDDGLIPLHLFGEKQLYGLDVGILKGGKKILTVNSGDPNYYVGCVLIAMLLEKQQRSMAASTQG